VFVDAIGAPTADEVDRVLNPPAPTETPADGWRRPGSAWRI
jgi:hypothetical protein